jgi:hypothetical protein
MFKHTSRVISLVVAATTLGACVSQPPPPPPPPRAFVPPVDTHVYAYPRNGQSDEQLDRDRYECHLWAVRQSGFDPSGPNVPPEQRIVVVRQGGPNQGATTAAGAFTGAVIGAAVSNPRNAGLGAVIGAIAGGALGAAAGSQQPTTTTQVIDTPGYREMERAAGAYRRALTACLDGRGYTVR